MHSLLVGFARHQNPDALTIAQAVRALPHAVGPSLAPYCEVVGLSAGVLQVRCSHPAVRSELRARVGWAETLAIAGVTAVEFL